MKNVQMLNTWKKFFVCSGKHLKIISRFSLPILIILLTSKIQSYVRNFGADFPILKLLFLSMLGSKIVVSILWLVWRVLARSTSSTRLRLISIQEGIFLASWHFLGTGKAAVRRHLLMLIKCFGTLPLHTICQQRWVTHWEPSHGGWGGGDPRNQGIKAFSG